MRSLHASRQAPPDTAVVAGSAGISVQVGAFFVRKPRPGGCHGVRFKRSVPVTVNDVLGGHVALDLECLDRLHLQGYLGQLQVREQVIQFLTHRGFKIYPAACLQQIGDGFRRRVASFAEASDIPVVPLKAADRNIEVMRPYLDKAAAGPR